MARPTKYRKEFVEQSEKLCKLGATDKELADFFEVCEDTITEWKRRHPKFSLSVKKGKEKHDTKKVEGALLYRALGYEHNEDKFFVIKGKVVKKRTIKCYPPDTAACLIWLCNRLPDRWKRNPMREGDGDESLSDALRKIADKLPD